MKKEHSQKDAWFLYTLALVFITLKLTGSIDWSWWWVTAPLWGGAAVVLTVTALFVLFSYILPAIFRRKSTSARRFNKQ